MSKVIKTQVKDDLPKFGVKDTDFLLKLIGRSTFEGNEVEQAYMVIQKLGAIHRRNIET